MEENTCEMHHLSANTMDSHQASIELSNRCREFYNQRMDRAESARQKLSPRPDCKQNNKSSLHMAMERLGEEMVNINFRLNKTNIH